MTGMQLKSTVRMMKDLYRIHLKDYHSALIKTSRNDLKKYINNRNKYSKNIEKTALKKLYIFFEKVVDNDNTP